MVKPCVLISFFWALCFSSARNDLDSKYKELCNCCAACVDLIRIQGLTLGLLPVSPTTGYQRNRLNEGVKNVTDSDINPALIRGHCGVEVDLIATCNGNAKAVRAFPGGNGVYCSMPSKQYVAAAHRWT